MRTKTHHRRLWSPGRRRFTLVIALWILSTLASWKLNVVPGVLLFGGAVLVAVVGYKALPHRQVLLVNFGGIAAAFLVAELYCRVVLHAGLESNDKSSPARVPAPVSDKREPGVSWIKTDEEDGRGDSAVYFSPTVLEDGDHDNLRLQSNARVRSKRVTRGMLVYDVTYTLNEHGFRVTPAAAPGRPTVAFWGCSFVFGRGLEDDQTLPSQFALRSQGRFSALNFGLCGHAPNSALALLEENGERPSTADVHLVAGVYLTMDDHPRRVMGARPWTRGLPRYVLRNGVAVRDGIIEDTSGYGWMPSDSPRWFQHNLAKWALADMLLKVWVGRQSELYVAVLKRTAEVFEARYHAPFVVVAWLDDDPQDRALCQALAGAGLRLLDLRDLLNARNDALAIPGDGHPSAFANSVVADKLLAYLEAMGERSEPRP